MAADFTIADVLAWARTKPADETYDYCDNGNCAIAQFLRETGRSAEPSVDPFSWTAPDGREVDLPDGLDDASGNHLRGRPLGATFGAFADRLEQVSI